MLEILCFKDILAIWLIYSGWVKLTLSLCLCADYQMMPVCISRKSLHDASRPLQDLMHLIMYRHFLLIRSSIIQFYSLICTEINAKWEQLSKVLLYKWIQ